MISRARVYSKLKKFWKKWIKYNPNYINTYEIKPEDEGQYSFYWHPEAARDYINYIHKLKIDVRVKIFCQMCVLITFIQNFYSLSHKNRCRCLYCDYNGKSYNTWHNYKIKKQRRGDQKELNLCFSLSMEELREELCLNYM